MILAHLEVYDHCEHEDGGNEVHEVGQVLSVECFSQGTHLVRAGGQQMKESNDCSLKLSTWRNHRNHNVNRCTVNIALFWNESDDSELTSASVDGSGAEGFPDDGFADVGGDEERDTRAQAVALLEQLVQQQDNQTCNEELKETDRRFRLSPFTLLSTCLQ